jgi:large subunit ribosomal protein L31
MTKETCLFFDQLNNYANFRCEDRLRRLASTDLSTVIVDNLNGTVMTQGLTFQLAEPSCPRAQVRISFAAPFLALIFTIWPEERVLRRGDRSVERLDSAATDLRGSCMKAGIHPEYKQIMVTCTCGNKFETRSTIGHDLQVEVCSNCHPFYTGKQKIVDTGGRVDKFRKRYAAAAKA